MKDPRHQRRSAGITVSDPHRDRRTAGVTVNDQRHQPQGEGGSVLASGRVLRRWLTFSSVGALGFGVQFAALLALAGWFELNYLVATAVAVELAILHNFLWHQRWTWSDRGTMSARHMVERLLRFNAGTAVTSIGGNLALMWLFVSLFDIHYALANVMAVLSLSIINFLFCDRLVFRLAELPLPGPSLAPETGEH